MQDFILPIISTLATALITWFFARRKNNAEAKSAELENEIKSAEFYRSLLDDAKSRLDEAISAINERDKRIEDRDERIKERDARIDQLIVKVEILTHELEKYKQLNGKAK